MFSIGAAGKCAHPCNPAYAVRDQAHQTIDAEWMVAGGFALHQFAYQRDRLVLFLPRVTKEAIHS